MKPTLQSFAILVSLALIGGCIVGDELTTITVNPDGSAELVLFRSNLRSTEKGERAERELADYKAAFEAQTDNQFTRIRDAGGKILVSSWVRDRVPFSNVVHARFPDATVLEKYWTDDSEDGGFQVTTRFHRDANQRKITIQIAVSAEKIASLPAGPSGAAEAKQALADGISETRIAVAHGSITASRGFRVAKDKQSALMDVSSITEIIRQNQGQAELFLEWEVLGKQE